MEKNIVMLYFSHVDLATGNIIYAGTDGSSFASVEGKIHHLTGEGEPLSNVDPDKYRVAKGEPVYDPNDRFSKRLQNALIKTSHYNFGDGIRVLRLLKGWSQEDMAYELDMSLTGYSKIERNITDVKFSRIVQISTLFFMKPSALLLFIEMPRIVNRDSSRV